MFLLRSVLSLLLLLGLLPWQVAAADTTDTRAEIRLMSLEGAVGPATADYLVRGLEQAAQTPTAAVVLQINTPGGLDLSMRTMIAAILASPVPVLCHVAPGGARAASAGTYLLYSCHVAAMSPATNLGAATPVAIGGVPATEPDSTQPADESAPVDQMRGASALERKATNDAVAYIRSLAELRGRNADWAEQAVRQGSSLSATEALEKGVIDLIATDLDDLLRQVEGRQVELNGRSVTLALAGLPRVEHLPDWRSRFLAVITNPNVAYLLMLIGIYGLIFEFSNPGFGVPGVLGAICLMMALYALQLLPISYAGLGLLLLGIGLIIAEAYAPSFGILGIGGAIAFIVGSIMLMDTELPAYQIAWPVIIALGVTTLLLAFGVVAMALRARHRPQTLGTDAARGQVLVVERLLDENPMVRFESELWPVRCDQPLAPGDRVRVTGSAGLHLLVDKQER
jgi:membrane-bound serine protease (ClpP class)